MEYIRFNAALTFDTLVERVNALAGAPVDLQTRDNLLAVIGVANGRHATPGTLCFVDRPPAPEALALLQQAIIITNPDVAPLLPDCTLIVTDDARALFIDLLGQIRQARGFAPFSSLTTAAPGIDASAEIHPQAILEENVHVGPDSRIAAGCVLKQNTFIGARVTVRENTVIGSDGIALYKAKDGRVLRFPHLAGVIVEDGVEIGANCVISGGVLNATRIGADCVIGNLSNIGHAAQIGAKVWMSVGCLIGGNSTLGERSTLGLGVRLRDNIRIGNDCSLGMGAVVVNAVENGHSVFGNPARRLPEVNAGPDR